MIVAVILATPAMASSQTITAAWDANPTTDNVLTYEICVGTTPLSCNVQLASVPATQTSYTFSPTPGVLHRVAVRAVSAVGAGSYSPEVTVSIPAVNAIANRTSNANTAITPLTVTATDPDGSSLTFAHTGLPIGLTLNPSTGVISGTPTATGTYNVTILVNDGLATGSASFVWTIQSGSSDTTAPALAITSHTSGQTINTTSITLSGTASDSGSGNSGVGSVTVNGVAATGGSATGSNIANWSRSLTLASGSNVITVIATDSVGNARSQQLTITVQIPDTAAPSLSITSHTSGQLVNTASITLSGTATDSGSGGNGIGSVTINGTAATGTSTGNTTANWSGSVTLAAGSNVLTVVATDRQGNSRQVAITINKDSVAPALSITSHTSGQAVTTSSITLSGTATDSGGGGNGVTSVTVNGTTATGTATGSGTASWSRTVSLVMGANTLTVTARDGANNATTSTLTVNRIIAAVGSVTLSSNLASPQLTNSAITFTAAGTGGVTPYQYKFLVQQGSGTAQIARNWSTTATYTWTPTAAGSYTVTVWARSNGVTADVPDASAQAVYDIVIPQVQAISTAPSSGSGSSQTFSLQYSDTRGANSLVSEWVWFMGGTGTCMAYHERSTNTVYLITDDGSSWTSRTMGSGSLQNSSCSVNLASSSVSTSGNVLTLNLAVAFTPAFNGTKTARMFANAAGSLSSGWQDRGSWTVPAQSAPPTPPPPVPPSAGTVSAVSVTPSSGTGASQLFSLQYADTRGATSLATEWVWFMGGSGLCMAYHDRAANTVSLLDDAGSAWATAALGSGTLQNSSCSVNLASSSASVSGTTLTLNLAVNFSSSFGGAKTIRMFANGAGALASGWQDLGTWTVLPPGVSAISVSPGSGSGTTQTFVLQYSDSRGASNLVSEWVWFSGANGACMISHEQSTNRVFMLDDAGTGWISGTPGIGVIQNSMCSVNLSGMTASSSGSIMTVTLPITFNSAFRGTKQIQMFANAAGQQSSGWQNRGTWIVP